MEPIQQSSDALSPVPLRTFEIGRVVIDLNEILPITARQSCEEEVLPLLELRAVGVRSLDKEKDPAGFRAGERFSVMAQLTEVVPSVDAVNTVDVPQVTPAARSPIWPVEGFVLQLLVTGGIYYPLTQGVLLPCPTEPKQFEVEVTSPERLDIKLSLYANDRRVGVLRFAPGGC